MPRIECVRSVAVQRTGRVRQLEGLFDVPPTTVSKQQWSIDLPIEERDWSIGLILGPSGSGKTTIARELWPDKFREFEWAHDKSVVDCFPPSMGIKEITSLLSSVGFSSPPSWLRPFRCLSNGEQFRVTIARELAEATDICVVDEFTSVVDRTVAKIGSAAIAKAVRRSGRRFVAVSCHYDIIEWLCPDWTCDPSTGEFQWRLERRRPEVEIAIQRVHRSAWRLFGHHHYLSGKLHTSSACFAGFVEGRPAAFTAVGCRPSPAGGFWQEHRTVCLPCFQGIGIGNAVSDYVASLYAATGKSYCSTTGNPAMIGSRAASPHWEMTRKPSVGGVPQDEKIGLSKTLAAFRMTASFRWCGPVRHESARAFGVIR